MNLDKRTRSYRAFVKVIICGFVASMMSSCSSEPRKVDQSKHTVSKISNSWVKVRSRPPTWYPRGVPADHPTDFSNGSWTEAEDSLGTRFFIPTHGLPVALRKSLKAEALAARHPARAREMATEGVVKDVGAGAVGVVGNVILGIARTIGRMGGP